MLDKKCNFTLCISKIDEEAICEFQFACLCTKSDTVYYVIFQFLFYSNEFLKVKIVNTCK